MEKRVLVVGTSPLAKAVQLGMTVGSKVKEHYQEAKAEQNGEARSKARMIKQARDIPSLAHIIDHTEGPAQPTDVAVRMLDGIPMRFFSDGSLRHAFGRPNKAARKKLKKLRRKK